MSSGNRVSDFPPNIEATTTPRTDERFENRGQPPRVSQNLERGSDFLNGYVPEPNEEIKVKPGRRTRRRGLIGDVAPCTFGGLGSLISIGYRYSLANFHAYAPPINTGRYTNGTKTKKEYVAYLGEVHQSGDARLVPVQPRKRLLPFRQYLIPPDLAGHVRM
jgi:hypothetical protein